MSYLYPIIKSISLINLAELGNVYVLCIHYLSWITNLCTLPPENAKKKKIRIRFENWWAVLARQFSDKSCANYPYQGIMTCEWVKTSFLMAVQSKCDVSLLSFVYILLRSIQNIQSFIYVATLGPYITYICLCLENIMWPAIKIFFLCIFPLRIKQINSCIIDIFET